MRCENHVGRFFCLVEWLKTIQADGRWRHVVTSRGARGGAAYRYRPTACLWYSYLPHHRTTSRRPRRQCLQVAPPQVTQSTRLLSFYCNIAYLEISGHYTVRTKALLIGNEAHLDANDDGIGGNGADRCPATCRCQWRPLLWLFGLCCAICNFPFRSSSA